MSFHKSKFGSFGQHLPCDTDGYVPTEDDGPFHLNFLHEEGESLHDENGNLTEYGEWWVEEKWPEIKEGAIEATREAQRDLNKWRES